MAALDRKLRIDDVREIVAEKTGIPAMSYQGIRSWVSRGVGGHRLNATRVGGRIFIEESDLLAFLDKITARA